MVIHVYDCGHEIGFYNNIVHYDYSSDNGAVEVTIVEKYLGEERTKIYYGNNISIKIEKGAKDA